MADQTQADWLRELALTHNYDEAVAEGEQQ